MVDLAIAANFVRELTEEQFEEQQRRAPRRGTPAGRDPKRAAEAVRAPDRAERAAEAARAPDRAKWPAEAARATDRAERPEGRRPDPAPRRRAAFGATRMGRALSRLAQVRG